jgi:hypothetical protein
VHHIKGLNALLGVFPERNDPTTKNPRHGYFWAGNSNLKKNHKEMPVKVFRTVFLLTEKRTMQCVYPAGHSWEGQPLS